MGAKEDIARLRAEGRNLRTKVDVQSRALKSQLDRMDEINAEITKITTERLLPVEPEVGAIVGFTKWFTGDKVYRYSAIRHADGWAVTGRTTMAKASWTRLMAFIEERESNPNRAKDTLRRYTKAERILTGEEADKIICEVRHCNCKHNVEVQEEAEAPSYYDLPENHQHLF
jgi:hypothetical protein